MASSLKDMYNEEFIEGLSNSLTTYYPKFDGTSFRNSIFDSNWEARELMDRMHHIAFTMQSHIPEDYQKSITILKKVCIDVKTGFEQMIFPDFVEQFGMEDWETSMEALAHFTSFCSSEFAIRPFIQKDKKRAIAQMLIWSKDKNVHLRRLASEGCRSRLPWAMALPDFKKDPSLVIPILENLIDDKEKYVQKSVANHLNDISKDNPKLALKFAKKWIGNSERSRWIIKHAMRTLLKDGNVEALRMFDFKDPKFVKDLVLELNAKKHKLGETVEFEIKMQILKKEKLRLEFGVDYMKSNGKQNRKLFQISEKVVETGSNSVVKKIQMVNLSTRKLYPGIHGIAVIANGVEMAREEFELIF